LLSHRLGLKILDTGAMYRAVAVAAQKAGIATSDADALQSLTAKIKIEFSGPELGCVTLDGEDVTDAIRTLPIGQAASELSVHSGVRRELVRQQQNALKGGGFVLEGRDTTTVVAPGADLKVFLTASIEERARRRWLEFSSKGGNESLQAVAVDVVARDYRDYSRQDSPLMLADDAVIVETFGLTPPDVVEKIVRILTDRGIVAAWAES
jgi:cytidylate kinase